MRIYIYIYMYTYVYICVYIYIYVYTYTHPPKTPAREARRPATRSSFAAAAGFGACGYIIVDCTIVYYTIL